MPASIIICNTPVIQGDPFDDHMETLYSELVLVQQVHLIFKFHFNSHHLLHS